MKTKRLGLGEGSLERLAQMASRNKKAVPFLIHAVKEWATLLVLLPACLAGTDILTIPLRGKGGGYDR